jgi:hypothetical protein
MPFDKFTGPRIGRMKNMETRQFIDEAVNGPEADTRAAREQAAEIKAASDRAARIKRLEAEVETLRGAQHDFIRKAASPPEGWRELGVTDIGRIVGISRPRIYNVLGRVLEGEIPEEAEESE